MDETDNYNGWRNYETWCVHLWLSNEESSWNRALELGRCAGAANRPFLESALQDWLESSKPRGLDLGVHADLIGHALARVDWREVADAILEAVDDIDSHEPPAVTP